MNSKAVSIYSEIAKTIQGLAPNGDSLDICDRCAIRLHRAIPDSAESLLVDSVCREFRPAAVESFIHTLGYLGYFQDGLSWSTTQWLLSLARHGATNALRECAATALLFPLSWNASQEYNRELASLCINYKSYINKPTEWLNETCVIRLEHYNRLIKAESRELGIQIPLQVLSQLVQSSYAWEAGYDQWHSYLLLRLLLYSGLLFTSVKVNDKMHPWALWEMSCGEFRLELQVSSPRRGGVSAPCKLTSIWHRLAGTPECQLAEISPGQW